nr:hypothetical protein [Ignavibacteriaceae bacterium]
LPKFAEISIWSLSGEKITTLKENDGNGGLSWNFISEDGRLIGSGIYIYRISMLNSANEEMDVKLGKIAVVK